MAVTVSASTCNFMYMHMDSGQFSTQSSVRVLGNSEFNKSITFVGTEVTFLYGLRVVNRTRSQCSIHTAM